MHIEVRGRGPALVLLHGWAMHSGIFAPLTARLENCFTLYLVDLPGHGRSLHSPVPLQREAGAAALASRVPRARWLGWSLGGLVALHAAQTRPEVVSGLVMVCASPRFVRCQDWPGGSDPLVFERFGHELARDYRGTIDRFVMLEAQGSDHAREEIRLLRDQVFAHGEASPAHLLQGLALLQDSDLRAGLWTLATPALWLAGRRDRLVSPQALRAAAALTPHATFAQIHGGGHAPFLTHADETAQAIIEFSERSPAGIRSDSLPTTGTGH